MKIKSTTLSNNYLRFTDKQHLFFIVNFTSILRILRISILRILHINFKDLHINFKDFTYQF